MAAKVVMVAVPTVLGIASIRVYTVSDEVPTDGLVRRKELNIYTPVPPSAHAHFVPEAPGVIQRGLTAARETVLPLVHTIKGACVAVKTQSVNLYYAGEDVYYYLKDPPPGFLPRFGTITMAGLLGMFLARKGSRVKRLAVPLGLMSAGASVCYPAQTVALLKVTSKQVYAAGKWSSAAVASLLASKSQEPAVKDVAAEQPQVATAVEESSSAVPETQTPTETSTGPVLQEPAETSTAEDVAPEASDTKPAGEEPTPSLETETAEAAPVEAAPVETATTEAAQVEAPVEAAPAETAAEASPVEAAPAEVEAPVEAAPAAVEAPVEAAPAEVEAPVEAAPVETAAEASPVEAAPVEASPVEASPVEAAPVEAAPAEATPAETAAEAAPVESLVEVSVETPVEVAAALPVPSEEPSEEPAVPIVESADPGPAAQPPQAAAETLTPPPAQQPAAEQSKGFKPDPALLDFGQSSPEDEDLYSTRS